MGVFISSDTAVSTAANLLSILLSLTSIAVTLSAAGEGVGVAVGAGVAVGTGVAVGSVVAVGIGVGVLLPQVGRLRLAASPSATPSRLAGIHPVKLLPLRRR